MIGSKEQRDQKESQLPFALTDRGAHRAKKNTEDRLTCVPLANIENLKEPSVLVRIT